MRSRYHRDADATSGAGLHRPAETPARRRPATDIEVVTSIDDPRLAAEIPLAVNGIVPCRVTAENGAIEAGDLLVTSSIAGHAMKGTDRTRMLGAIVGKALESLKEGTGAIQVLVTLQ